MPASSLDYLANEFCELGDVPASPLATDSTGALSFSATVRGVDITVSHDPLRHPDHAIALLFFGQIPEDRELLILRQLLNFNLDLLQPNFPAFSRNPLTGNVILQYVFPLAQAMSQAPLDGLARLVEAILKWRQEFFLDDSAFTPASSMGTAVGQLA